MLILKFLARRTWFIENSYKRSDTFLNCSTLDKIFSGCGRRRVNSKSEWIRHRTKRLFRHWHRSSELYRHVAFHATCRIVRRGTTCLHFCLLVPPSLFSFFFFFCPFRFSNRPTWLFSHYVAWKGLGGPLNVSMSRRCESMTGRVNDVFYSNSCSLVLREFLDARTPLARTPNMAHFTSWRGLQRKWSSERQSLTLLFI